MSAASSRLQRRVQVYSDSAHDRGEAEQNAGEKRNAERKREDATINSDIFQTWDIPWVHGADHIQARACDYKPSGSPKERREDALCE